ncbi:MAG TPA: hypothetical protein VJ882_04015, partial [Desulfuromonadales bacterium]|nr:hypothetical protein [Desulfuromonadales bacterium]
RPLPPSSQVRIFDLAAEALEFQYIRGEIDQDVFRGRYVSLLGERSRLGTVEEAYTDIPEPVRPDKGHGSNRLVLGAGLRGDDAFAEVQLRPAYHNLLDNDAGYLAGSQIDFTNLVLRHYPERDKTELYELDLVNIVSLSPRNPFFKPVSWKIETGLEQMFFNDGNDHLAAFVNPGGGFAYGNFSHMAYGMLETDLRYSGRFRDNYLLGFGASAGFLASAGEDWKFHFWGRNIHYEIGDKADQHQKWSAHLDQNFRVNTDNSISLHLSRHRESTVYFTEAVLGWNYYW